jgi:hypothetical protein
MVQEARQVPGLETDGRKTSGPTVDLISKEQQGNVDGMEIYPKTAEKVTAAPASLNATRVKKSFVRRASRVMFILSLVGTLGFLGGAALAASILLGAIDLDSVWLKEAIKFAKETLKHLRS